MIELSKKSSNALKWISVLLRKEKIPFVITGGLAAKLYGSPRPLNDIDIDIPNDRLAILTPRIKDFIVFGPARFKDKRWDLELISLNYKGQEIDISGGDDLRINDERTGKWTHVPTDFGDPLLMPFGKMELPVISPNDLIRYKSMLKGSHQKVDIKAVRHFIDSRIDNSGFDIHNKNTNR